LCVRVALRERHDYNAGMNKFGARSSCDAVVAGLDLRGRNILVTGANSGIGFETARSLASVGAHVLVGCRDAIKTADTVTRIKAHVPNAQLSELAIDLASFASVRAAAVQVGAVDTLIFNAGLYAADYAETADGIESTVGVCHFAHFLLFSLLRAKLSPGARIVSVASESHRFPARLRLDKFPLDPRSYRPLIAYGQAKLCNVLFTNELARRHPEFGAYSLHPGSFIGTSIFRSSIVAKALALAVRPFTKTLAQGAATTVYCATAANLSSGRYYADCREKPMSEGAQDRDVAARLWELSEARVVDQRRLGLQMTAL
jgi:WW domain-containing oxidoreductase